MNLYQVVFHDHRKIQQGHSNGWRFFKVLSENETQIIEYLDKYYPDRKKCMFDRAGEPSNGVAHDWTEIKLWTGIKYPFFIEEDK